MGSQHAIMVGARALGLGLASLISLSVAVAMDGTTTAVSPDPQAENVAVAKLSYGINEFYPRASSRHWVVIRSHRENFNAHDMDVFSIYSTSITGGPSFEIVGALERGVESEVFKSSGGADCKTNDIRILVGKDGDIVRLIAASRPLGKSYIDEQQVRFKTYELRRNESKTPGRPPFYFELINIRASKKVYCDVTTAFLDELRLGGYD